MTIFVFCGPPCSGKTTKSKKYALDIGCLRFSVDEISEELYGAIPLSSNQRDTAYDRMHKLAVQAISRGYSVVLDATYARKSQQERLFQVSKNTSSELKIYEISVDPEEAVCRFLKRENHTAKDLDENRVRHLAKTYPYGWSRK